MQWRVADDTAHNGLLRRLKGVPDVLIAVDQLEPEVKVLLILLGIEETKVHLKLGEPHQRAIEVGLSHLAGLERSWELGEVRVLAPVPAVHVGAGLERHRGAVDRVGKAVTLRLLGVDIADRVAVGRDICDGATARTSSNRGSGVSANWQCCHSATQPSRLDQGVHEWAEGRVDGRREEEEEDEGDYSRQSPRNCEVCR